MFRRSILKNLSLLAVSAISVGTVSAAEPPAPRMMQGAACEEIRASIRAQTAVREKPDVDLLDRLSAHAECSFTASEAFRAAFGPMPMPQHERPHYRTHQEHDDD